MPRICGVCGSNGQTCGLSGEPEHVRRGTTCLREAQREALRLGEPLGTVPIADVEDEELVLACPCCHTVYGFLNELLHATRCTKSGCFRAPKLVWMSGHEVKEDAPDLFCPKCGHVYPGDQAIAGDFTECGHCDQGAQKVRLTAERPKEPVS